jgi:hypothetical protein
MFDLHFQLFGLPYTLMHSILPILLLGSGIDNMFVIMQSFTNIKVSIKILAHVK